MARFEFCCRTKLVEGISQETTRLLFVVVRFIAGDGVVCKVQIPPLNELVTDSAASFVPSAEETMLNQLSWTGTEFELHIAPEFVEVRIMPAPWETATSLVPSADEATPSHFHSTFAYNGTLFEIQVFPELVEV